MPLFRPYPEHVAPDPSRKETLTFVSPAEPAAAKQVTAGAANDDEQDARDAQALYRLLEEQVVPTFYDRDTSGVSHAWLAIVKEAIRTVTPRFCARRMVKEYPVASNE